MRHWRNAGGRWTWAGGAEREFITVVPSVTVREALRNGASGSTVICRVAFRERTGIRQLVAVLMEPAPER